MRQADSFRVSPVVAWMLLSVVAFVALFVSLGSHQTIGSHEAAAVVPAREMLHSGDWVVPRFAEVPRLQKPPLVYWLIAANSGLSGAFNEFTARLHSALAALALTALMSLWAWRWYGREAAFGAALIQVSSVWVLIYGRRAEVDMVLCLLITATLFLIAHQPDSESRSRRGLRWFAIEALLGISWLAKFHFGIAMVVGPVLVWWCLERRWRNVKDVFNPLGLLLAAACVVVWPALVMNQLPEAFSIWRSETVGRATGELRGSPADPWWNYFPSLLVFTLPWTGTLLASVPASWQRAWRSGDARERFVWLWLLTDFGIAWASPDKNANYLLPALVPATLLSSQVFARIVSRTHRLSLSIPRSVAVLGTSAAVGVGIALALFAAPRWPDALPVIQCFGLFFALTASVVCVLLARRKGSLAGWTSLAGSLGLYVMMSSWLMPAFDARIPQAEFAHTIRHEVASKSSVFLFEVSGIARGLTPVAFYLDEPIHRLRTESELRECLQANREVTLVTEFRHLEKLERLADVQVLRVMPSGSNRDERGRLACVRARPAASAEQHSARLASPPNGQSPLTVSDAR